jgi:hypothetical protein
LKNKKIPHYELVQAESLGENVISVIVRDKSNKMVFKGVIQAVNNPKDYFITSIIEGKGSI